MEIKYKITVIAILVVLAPISFLFILGSSMSDGDIDNLDKETCTKIDYTIWNETSNRCELRS